MTTLVKGEFILKKAIILVLSMALLSACSSEPSQAEQDLEDVNNDISELQSEIQSVRSENETVESDIENKEKELEELSSGDSSDDSDENAEENTEEEDIVGSEEEPSEDGE